MEQILLAREAIIKFYKRYETIFVIVFKFIIGVVIFSLIGGIDRSMAMFEKIASTAGGVPYIILMSLIFAVTPINAGYLLITLNLCLQTSAVLEVALVLGIFLLAVQGLYTRLAPTECVLILAMLAAWYFKLPYTVPILAGLYFSLTSMIPIAIATFMWQFLPLMLRMFTEGQDTVLSVDGLTEVYQMSYAQIVSGVTGNHDWIIISFVFAMVVVIVYVVSHSTLDYGKEIAIGVGGAMTIVGLLIAVLVTDVQLSVPGMLLSVVGSVAVILLIRFFDVLLDYQSAERVQFQDDENVYYVKIVPKIIMEKSEGRVVVDDERALVRVPAPAREHAFMREHVRVPDAGLEATADRRPVRPAPERRSVSEWRSVSGRYEREDNPEPVRRLAREYTRREPEDSDV